MKAMSMINYRDTHGNVVFGYVTVENNEVRLDGRIITPEEWVERCCNVVRFTDLEYENLVRWSEQVRKERG